MTANHRQQQELFGLRERLEKNLGKSDDGGAEETIKDILNVLNNFNMTIELLSETSIGQTVADIMKKYGETDLGQQSKKLLKKWKKELKNGSELSSSKISSSSHESKEEKVLSPPSISTAQTDNEAGSFKSATTPVSRGVSEGDGSWGFEDDYANLEPRRLSVCILIYLFNFQQFYSFPYIFYYLVF